MIMLAVKMYINLTSLKNFGYLHFNFVAVSTKTCLALSTGNSKSSH